MVSPINIESFKSQLQFGGARPSLFQVQLFLGGAANIGNLNEELFTFLCKGAQLPSLNVEAIDVSFQDRKIKVPGSRTFPDWTVTVYNDEDFSIRNNFMEWSNRINGLEVNVTRTSVVNNLKGSAVVNQLSREGVVLASYQMVGCFPTEISAIDLSWESNNAIEEYTVTFAYDYWVPVRNNEGLVTTVAGTPIDLETR